MELQPHQQRVVTEKQELDEKRSKLKSFTEGETFKGLDEKNQELLTKQQGIMDDYSAVLQERIELF